MAADLDRFFRRLWLKRSPLARLLTPLSFIAEHVVRRRLQQALDHPPAALEVPVIVVGNVVAGGAGKTPTVMALVEHLKGRGLMVGVVSRGHGRSGTHCTEVGARSLAADVGDEPLLIQRRSQVPVFVGASRLDAVRTLLAAYPSTQVIVADDGLQHWKLPRDLDLCLIDDRGLGNGWLLPAGPLREPWPLMRPRAATERAPCLVVHTGEYPAWVAKDEFHSPRQLERVAVDGHGQRVPLPVLSGQPLAALAGIARPERFFAMLRTAGLTLDTTLALPDHYDFESWKSPFDKGLRVICTEKDAIKLWPHHPDILAVGLQARLPLELLARIDAVVDAKLSSPHGHQTA